MSIIAKPISVYQIGIGGDTEMRIPQFCTCCLTPTDSSERIHFVNTSRGLLLRSKTYTFLTLPLCPECSRHRFEQSSKKYLALLLSIVAGLGLFISLEPHQLHILLRLWLFATLSLAIFFLSDKYFPFSKLDKSHATRGISVAFAHVDTKHNLAILNFASKEYTKLLCTSNKWTYSQAVTKSEVSKYTFIIVAICLLLGLLLQEL